MIDLTGIEPVAEMLFDFALIIVAIGFLGALIKLCWARTK